MKPNTYTFLLVEVSEIWISLQSRNVIISFQFNFLAMLVNFNMLRGIQYEKNVGLPLNWSPYLNRLVVRILWSVWVIYGVQRLENPQILYSIHKLNSLWNSIKLDIKGVQWQSSMQSRASYSGTSASSSLVWACGLGKLEHVSSSTVNRNGSPDHYNFLGLLKP